MTTPDPSETPSPDRVIEPWLRAILRCPACRAELNDDTAPTTDEPELVCTNTECALAYPVDGGVPVLLIDAARRPNSTGTGAA